MPQKKGGKRMKSACYVSVFYSNFLIVKEITSRKLTVSHQSVHLSYTCGFYNALHTRNISTLSNNFLVCIWQLVLAHPQVRTE